MTKTCILVLGMHRSGTSAFTRVLSLLGAGLPKTLMMDRPDNATGHWESTRIVELNDRILLACGSKWDDWGPLNIEISLGERKGAFEEDIARAVAEEFGDQPLIVLKDPRISRLVPLYVAVLKGMGYELEFFHVLRDPQAVAAALKERNGIKEILGKLLWMRYQLEAEKATRGARRAFFSYEDLIQDWRPVADRIQSALSLSRHVDVAIEEKVSAFIRPDLRQPIGSTYGNDLGEAEKYLNEIYGTLCRLESDQVYPEALDFLDAARRRLEELVSLCSVGRPCGPVQQQQLELEENRWLADSLAIERKEAQTRFDTERADLQAGLNREKARLHAVLIAAQTALAEARRETVALTHIAEKLDAELIRARNRPIRNFGILLKYRVLRALSKATPPLPVKMTQRFRRSADKRNPRKSSFQATLADPANTALLHTAAKFHGPRAKEEFRRSSEAQLDAFLQARTRLQMPNTEQPVVTVILVLWNQAALTLACLRSLEAEFRVPIEVVVVDNASTDQTAELLSRVDNARIIVQTENLGFLRAVNFGLSVASGDHILLLNNDAVLHPGTLSAAVDTMQSAADVGAVGGRIILPTGRLQEAGSIIWSDGSCLGYGRDDDPESGEYMFRRDVDYCSGAFLLVNGRLFRELGGFDESYAPAYYEETDLCMRLNNAGYRVVFDPRVVIDHFEFGSSEKVSSALELQKRNQKLFCERHAEALRGQLPPSARNILRARMRDTRRRVLHIDDQVPIVTLGAGLPRTNEVLQILSDAGYFVTYFPSMTSTVDWEEIWAAVPCGVEVTMGRGLARLEQFLVERADYYDTIFVSRPHNMAALARIRAARPQLFSGLRVVYDAEALFASRDEIKAGLFGDEPGLTRAREAKLKELALVASADHVTAVSAAEALEFATVAGNKVSILGHSLKPAPTQASFGERDQIIFMGRLIEENSPNVDSLVWLVDEVIPILDTLLPAHGKLIVVGRSTAPSIRERAGKGLTLLGPIEDLNEVFERARVFVAPTRYAAGIPHKVHQAAAMGVPTVVTSLLAKQLGWADGEALLVGDTPEDFAAAIARLSQDEALWTRIRQNALSRVEQECAPEAFRKTLLKAVS